jgi:hypothetical protein
MLGYLQLLDTVYFSTEILNFWIFRIQKTTMQHFQHIRRQSRLCEGVGTRKVYILLLKNIEKSSSAFRSVIHVHNILYKLREIETGILLVVSKIVSDESSLITRSILFMVQHLPKSMYCMQTCTVSTSTVAPPSCMERNKTNVVSP